MAPTPGSKNRKRFARGLFVNFFPAKGQKVKKAGLPAQLKEEHVAQGGSTLCSQLLGLLPACRATGSARWRSKQPKHQEGISNPGLHMFFYFTITLVFYSWSHNKNILVRKILCSNFDVYVNSVSYDDAWTYVNYNIFFFITIVIWARY